MTDLDAPAIELLRELESSAPLVAAARDAPERAKLIDVFAAVGEVKQTAPTPMRRRALAGLLVGAVAEREFQRRYRAIMQGQEFSFQDQRSGSNETDFLILNGAGRPAFRITIKAHGTFFQRAKKFVGLEPEECFALATYKIRDAVRMSQEESLTFLFAVVSSPALAAGPIADSLPGHVRLLADTSGLCKGITGWRSIEDAIVGWMLGRSADEASTRLVETLSKAVRAAEWRVISAARAYHLLLAMLWERVPAVSKRNFGADPMSQPNMHFSLRGDMIGLDEFLLLLRDHGLQHVATRIAFRDI